MPEYGSAGRSSARALWMAEDAAREIPTSPSRTRSCSSTFTGKPRARSTRRRRFAGSSGTWLWAPRGSSTSLRSRWISHGSRSTSRVSGRNARARRQYGPKYRKLRLEFLPLVESGEWLCARCGEQILSGDPWDLDHDDRGDGYLGPSHQRCIAQPRVSSVPRGAGEDRLHGAARRGSVDRFASSA